MGKEKSEKKGKKREETEDDVDMVDGTDGPKVCDYCPFNLVTLLKMHQPPKKVKKEKEEIVIPLEDLSPLAHPLAQKKLLKKLHKTIKKGSQIIRFCFRCRSDRRPSIEGSTSQTWGEGGCERHPERRKRVRSYTLCIISTFNSIISPGS